MNRTPIHSFRMSSIVGLTIGALVIIGAGVVKAWPAVAVVVAP